MFTQGMNDTPPPRRLNYCIQVFTPETILNSHVLTRSSGGKCTSLSPDFRFGHVTCFGQWDAREYDVCNDLTYCVTELAPCTQIPSPQVRQALCGHWSHGIGFFFLKPSHTTKSTGAHWKQPRSVTARLTPRLRNKHWLKPAGSGGCATLL